MWKLKTPKEISISKKAERRARLIGAIQVGFAITLLMAFTLGYFEGGARGLLLTPLEEIPRRFPKAFIFGFIGGLIYFFKLGERPSYICPNCEGASKKSGPCRCGGNYEPLRNYKWE